MSCMVKDRYKAGLWNSIRKRWNIFNNKASFEVDMGEMRSFGKIDGVRRNQYACLFPLCMFHRRCMGRMRGGKTLESLFC